MFRGGPVIHHGSATLDKVASGLLRCLVSASNYVALAGYRCGAHHLHYPERCFPFYPNPPAWFPIARLSELPTNIDQPYFRSDKLGP
jgi:hypothetical protein